MEKEWERIENITPLLKQQLEWSQICKITAFTHILCILIFEQNSYSLHYIFIIFFYLPTTPTGLEQYHESKLYLYIPSYNIKQYTSSVHGIITDRIISYFCCNWIAKIHKYHISIIQCNCHTWFKMSSISIIYLRISLYISAVSVIFLILVFSCVTHKRGQAVRSHRRDRQATPTPIPQPSSQDLTVGRKWITQLPGYSLATT